MYYTIPKNTILYPNSCQVFTSDFNLNKSSSDTIRLFDSTFPPSSSSARLIDSYEYKASPGIGKSFLRLPDASTNWIATEESIGLFNLSKESCVITPTLTLPAPLSGEPILTYEVGIGPSPSSTPQPETPTSSPSISYQNIFISEVMVNPETGSNEWVELFNNNDFDVALSDWYLDDGENEGATPKKFTLDISAKNYEVIDLSSSIFNNDGDQVRILDVDKIQKDSFEYGKSQKGNSFGRRSFDSDEFCEQSPSKGEPNNECVVLEQTSSAEKKPTPSKNPIFIPTIRSTSSLSMYGKAQAASPYGTTTKEIPIEEILGVLNVKTTPNVNPALIRGLSFCSLSFSLLTTLLIFLRMKHVVSNGTTTP
ncbi:hypothetical protein COT62_01555 [Candidatus Roizmanbacteria bacterium CG09_land_8_20_14_0_10_41_9]|uniref:LTD domain-containing protein n=1 Tax=Candidatus Roizmanbacteria bacterium CG09_land_8_20_14_0_10_41_9 TaxID=1974850 RepID=A0A2H0WT51_9BACT|nr:MAG: hypothetical protein COT62_01555 [Candidatus Roizmanbacteria bacterium CG09_land_8_20_14_0_10_41_9]